MRQLRRTSCRQWRWIAQELSETAQVLRGRGEQHFVPGAAQAPQSKPVKLQDALHMRKSHLNLLAPAAIDDDGRRAPAARVDTSSPPDWIAIPMSR
jgi:hypothetical protein